MSITLSVLGLQAQISPLGAELVRLRDEDGRDLLWDGDPAFWTGRSPLLFPIVGRLRDDRTCINGSEYSLRQHGFARTSSFEVIEAGRDQCCLRLRSNRSTLDQYPFDFKLDVVYQKGSTLRIQATVQNTGQRIMPASFGFHPAFRWPLPYGGSREAHEIRFDRDETAPMPSLVDGLLAPAARPWRVGGCPCGMICSPKAP